jgi:hypothetical protein
MTVTGSTHNLFEAVQVYKLRGKVQHTWNRPD